MVQMESRVAAAMICVLNAFQSKEDTGEQRSGELSYFSVIPDNLPC